MIVTSERVREYLDKFEHHPSCEVLNKFKGRDRKCDCVLPAARGAFEKIEVLERRLKDMTFDRDLYKEAAGRANDKLKEVKDGGTGS